MGTIFASMTLQFPASLLASIPSPGTGVLHIGPLAFHVYGLCIALGVLAAVWLSNRRWTARGGRSDDITLLALWGVPAGIVGARIYHVLTDFEIYRHDLLRMFAIWDGGLGIWGGVAGGVGVGALVARRRGLSVVALLDTVGPGIVLAQAIGRWGNYFNQELFGKPSDLPWAVRIDFANRPDAYFTHETFHPTFLYESLWCLLICAALLLIDRYRPLRAGHLFAAYMAAYTFGRFFIERLRIDFAHTFLGLRVNEWVSVIIFAVAVGILLSPLVAKLRHRTA